MTNTLLPLEEPFDGGVREALERYPRVEGRLLALFRTFANSERFLRKGVPYLLDRDSPIDLRTREIVILRVTANNRCAYEWGVHAALFARAARFTETELAATWCGSADDAAWAAPERALIAALDELCACGEMRPGTREVFQRDWSVVQQLEILALCGAYHTVSYVANLAQIDAESFAMHPPGAHHA